MDIGSKIRAIINRNDITIAQMCEGTGLSKGFISNVENNNTSPAENSPFFPNYGKFIEHSIL